MMNPADANPSRPHVTPILLTILALRDKVSVVPGSGPARILIPAPTSTSHIGIDLPLEMGLRLDGWMNGCMYGLGCYMAHDSLK